MKKEFVFRLILLLCIAVLVYQFGIKPMLGNDFYLESRKTSDWASSKLTREKGVYDVVVVGEDPAGIAAALSAARTGAKTLLVSAGNDLGGVISRSLKVDMEDGRNGMNQLLDRGIFYELHDKLYEDSKKYFTVERYISVVNELVKEEKNLEVIFNAKVDSPVLEGNTIKGIAVSMGEGKKTLNGKRFIDATRDGSLLELCGVPYYTGSGDLNMGDSFLPVRLSFELSGVDWSKITGPVNEETAAKFYSALAKYETSYVNIKISDFQVFNQGNDRVIIQGLEVFGLNVADKNALAAAYRNAVAEAKEFARFLKNQFTIFENSRFEKAADEFYIRENRHFKGEYTLSVNEILENKDFHDKIAVGSVPVDGSKFTSDDTRYVICKPDLYGISLGCIIPEKIDNLFMVGAKASFSSLAASSAGAFSTGVTMGESAGVVAVFSITQDMTPREIVAHKDVKQLDQLKRLLQRQGIYLPQSSTKNKAASHWAYPALKQLNTLGLVAGGIDNDFRYDKNATQQDLAIILLNGVYRLSLDKYSLAFDARLRPYFIKDTLTKEKAGEIIAALYGVQYEQGKAYEKMCELDYINSFMQLKLKEKKTLTLGDVYQLGAYNIMQFTGKEIPN